MTDLHEAIRNLDHASARKLIADGIVLLHNV
jgi:hypothetical protein